MGWNGSGTFNRIYSWVADKAAGFDITASRMDTDTDDIASNGFGNCLTRDGQGQATANLPMATFRHTGVGNGVARNDYAALGQAQDGLIEWSTDTGAADALVVTLTPALTAYADGQLVHVRANHANATTTPTLNVSGLGAKTITRNGGVAVFPGDVAGSLAECIFRYNLANTRWELLNPATQSPPWVASGGSANAITATYSPAISALYDGLLCTFRATAANTTTTPTFAPNSLTAHTITRFGGSAIRIGDVPGNLAEVVLRYNLANTRWELLNPALPLTAPTRQVLTSGSSATYTTPAGATQLRIRMIGGGGGGGGNGSSSPGNGGNGGDTIFNAIHAAGGAGALATSASSGTNGGAGGSGGAGSASFRIPGGAGNPGAQQSSIFTPGGNGGNSAFGAGAAGSVNTSSAGSAAGSNSGAGGGGVANTVDSAGGGTGGGGAGEYVELIINSPSATYTYTVGALGAGGASGGGGGNAGGNGATGIIIVDEYYF